MKVLVTGGMGLIGSACCEQLAQKGHQVISLDNNTRGSLFGKDGSTKINSEEDKIWQSDKIQVVEGDIRDKKLLKSHIKDVDSIIHCAAQPSHPKSLEIPMEDFDINAFGTLQLLELTRQNNPDAPFCYMSTHKVYGSYPNFYRYDIVGKRYENSQVDSFDESVPLDQSGHTPFGVSKSAADLYTQEYAINYGLKTAAFRGCCLTGKNSRAVEIHGYLPYIIKCALEKKPYTIFGGGYRVRDQIHSSDVASAAIAFIEKPRKSQIGLYGQVYNLGGCRQNAVSIFETIDATEAKTGMKLKWKEGPARESDHMWWITDMSKFRRHYPEWNISKDLDYIFNEIIEYYIDMLGLKIKLDNKDYFKKTPLPYQS